MFRSSGGGGSASSVVTVIGPPGPAGPQGAPGQSYGNALISGGALRYVPTTLQFVVSAASYIINNNVYSSAETTVTLTAADGSNPRIDVIVLTSSGTVTTVDGTAAATPAEPTIDPLTQLRLTAVTVPTGATSIGVTTTDVYLEDAEWTASVSGAGMNKASVSNPHAGTKTIEATAATNGQYVNLANGSAFDTTTRNFLSFYIRSKGSFGNKSIVIRWYNSTTGVGTAVTLANGAYGFNAGNTSAYQLIGIPLSAFGVAGVTTTDLRFTVTGGGAAIGFYLDDIVLQGGVMVITPTDALRYRGEYSAAVQYQLNDVVLYSSLLYTPLQATLANAPTSTTYWKPLTGGKTISTQTGTTYTLLAADHGTLIRFTNGSTIEVTVPTGLRSDYNVDLTPTSTGRIHVLASGTTINAPFYRHRIGPANMTGTLRGTASNTFILEGASNIPNPTTITGCVFWMDAADGNSVTHSSNAISQINDLSGSGFHLTAAGGAQPTYRYGDFNGRNCIRFDGSSDALTNGSSTLLRNITGYSVFVVYRAASATPAAQMQLTAVSNATNTKFALIHAITTGLRQVSVRRVAADSGATLTGTQTTITAHIASVVVNHSTTTGTLWANGTSDATSSSYGTSGTADNVGGDICVGAGISGASAFFAGDIMEVIYYNTALSTADRNRVEGYLSNKWGVDVA